MSVQHKVLLPQKISLRAQTLKAVPKTKTQDFAWQWANIGDRTREGICHACNIPLTESFTMWPFICQEYQKILALKLLGLGVMCSQSRVELQGVIHGDI
jgi:hypothetical protein